MKSILNSLLTRAKCIRKRTWVLLAFMGCSIYFTYQEPETRVEQMSPRDGLHLVGNGPFKRVIAQEMLEPEDKTGSVKMKNGKYAVDTTFIYKNGNKGSLLADLANDELSEKNTVEAIPYVIRHFLDSIAANGKFDIADPDEKCQEQPFAPGQNIPSRKLLHFSIGEHIALLSFTTVGLEKSQHVAIIRFGQQQVTDFWFDNIDVPATKKDDILKYIMDHCVKGKSGNC